VRHSAHLAVLCLLLVIGSTPALASTPRTTPKRLWAEAYSAVVVFMTSDGIKAIEGIHVKESTIGPFNLLVVYNITSIEPLIPVPWKLFVDNFTAMGLLLLVFDESNIAVVDSISVSKVGLTATFQMGETTSLMVRALTPVKPMILSFHFQGAPGRLNLDIRGMQFPALASGFIDLSLVSASEGTMPVLSGGFLVPQARIEVARTG